MQDDIVPTPHKETPTNNSLNEDNSRSEFVSPGPTETTTPISPIENTSPFSSTVETETTQPLNSNPVDAMPVTPVVSGGQSTKKKKLIIGLIIVVVLAVLGGAGAAAYNLWFQNPDKVLGDALVNAVRAKTVTYTGSLDYKAKASTSTSHMKLTVDGKSTTIDGEMNVKLAMTYGGKDFNLSGSGLYDKDANFYFKVNDVRKMIDSVLNSSTIDIPKEIDDLITKIDGRWIKISVEDTKEFSEKYADTQKCMRDTLKKYENDKDATKEIVDLYNKNKFIVVTEKLGAKNGSLGYVIEDNTDKTKSFVTGLNETRIIKELQKCDKSFKLDPNDIKDESSNKSDSRFEVWVDRWSHQFTKFNLTDKDNEGDTAFIFEPKFNQPVSVAVPKDALSLSELKADIEKIQQDYVDNLKNSSSARDSGSMSEV